MMFKRMNFLEFVKAMVTASDADNAEEARDKIIPKMETVDSYVTAFTSVAANGAERRSHEDEPADEDDDENVEQMGVRNATAKGFWDWRTNLTPVGGLLADIISNTHIFTCLLYTSPSPRD